MANYTEYKPGPTVAEQYETIDSLVSAIFDQMELFFDGAVGASAVWHWRLSSMSEVGGANPHVDVNMFSPGSVHSATWIFRYNASLLGMLDPAHVWSNSDLPGNWWRAQTYAEVEELRVIVGTAAMATLAGNTVSGWMASLSGGGAFTGSSAENVLYTEGARATKLAGFQLECLYDPTAGEVTAGVRRSHFISLALVSDSNDGTLNSGATGASIGVAVNTVPVPVVTTPDAQESWLGLVEGAVTNNKNASHPDDIGESGGKSDEPAPGDVVPIFKDPGTLPAIGTDPSLWDGLTTLPSWLAAFLYSVGKAAAVITAGGFVASIAAVATILGTINTAVGLMQTAIAATQTLLENSIAVDIDTIADNSTTIATHAGSVATSAGQMVTSLVDIKTAIDTIDVAVDLGPIVTAIQTLDSDHVGGLVEATLAGAQEIDALTTATGNGHALQVVQLDRIADALELSVSGGGGGGYMQRIVLALESIADSLQANPLATPPAKKVSEQLAVLEDSLRDVADLQNSLTLDAHGYRVRATVGIDTP